MQRSRLVTILLALVLAGAAALGVYTLVNETQSDTTGAPTAVAPTAVPTAGVLVAKLDIASGTVLTEDMLDVEEIPAESRHARALTTVDQAVGKMAAVAIVTGEQILDTRVTEAAVSSENSFAGVVPVGKRAISVVFDEVIGAGALVQPGDHVDVLGFFEFDVDDLTFDEAGEEEDEAAAEEDATATSEEDEPDYKQYISVYIVQDVEVLAVSQALSPDQAGVAENGALPTPTPAVTSVAEVEAEETKAPVARPTAKSVTLAVSPEQAQRILLAAETVRDEQGSLRLAMRAPGDTTVVDLDPAKIGNIPLGELLGDVDRPMVPSDLVITNAEFTERIVASGGVLEFTVTVKNVSNRTITSGANAEPGYQYREGEAYDALGFFPDRNTYRIGLSFAGAYPEQYPYRWALGTDLEPGESVEITGSVQLTESTPSTRYWLGVILEPGTITQDGVAVAEISVVPSQTGTIRPKSVEVHAGPRESDEVTGTLARGDKVTILSTQNGWFEVRSGDAEGWIEAGELDVPALGAESDEVDPEASPVASPVS